MTGCMDDPVPTSGATQEQIEQASKDGLANAITKYINTGSNSSYSDIGYPQQMIYRDVMIADMPIKDPSYYYFMDYLEPLYIGDYQLQTDFWQRYYYLIKKCNICVGACSDSSEDALNLATGLVYRALAYLDLARWYEFHDSGVAAIDNDAASKGIKGLTVPIVTENTTEQQAFANPRAPFYEMYRFILTDLNRAERAMSKVSETPEINKPSLATIYGMKARLWLEIATRFRDYPEDLAEQIANDNVSYENVLGPGYALDPLGVTSANDAYRQTIVNAQKVIDSGATPMTEDEWHSVTSGFNTPTSAWLLAILMSSSDVMVTSNTWKSWVSFMAPEAKYGVSSTEYGAQHMIDKTLYEAMSDVPGVTIGRSMSQEQAIVELQSLYAVTTDRDYLLALLSRIDVNQGVSSVDNGISQEVSVKTGAVLKEQQTVQPIVHLQPYRTFLEVEQPVSDFLLRLDKEGHPALYEADGGAWKLEAKRSIAAYLAEKLADQVERGDVVVLV